ARARDRACAPRRARAASCPPARRRRREAARGPVVRGDRRALRRDGSGLQDALRPRVARPPHAPRAGRNRAMSALLDPEVLELLADEPELLALADALGSTRPPRRRPATWIASIAAAVAA